MFRRGFGPIRPRLMAAAPEPVAHGRSARPRHPGATIVVATVRRATTSRPASCLRARPRSLLRQPRAPTRQKLYIQLRQFMKGNRAEPTANGNGQVRLTAVSPIGRRASDGGTHRMTRNATNSSEGRGPLPARFWQSLADRLIRRSSHGLTRMESGRHSGPMVGQLSRCARARARACAGFHFQHNTLADLPVRQPGLGIGGIMAIDPDPSGFGGFTFAVTVWHASLYLGFPDRPR